MGLRRIVLRDFVIVGELDLDLPPGFTVLTGETGAGKSILIEAVHLVTGARADVGTVREGASRTDVSAEFDCPASLEKWLGEAGFDLSESLLMRRTVDLQGKSRGWVNGSPATATQMREIGEQLIDIHGQHAWQSLTRPDAVRGLLDAYAKLDGTALAASWHQWRLASKALADALAARDTLQRDRERLSWQIGELEKLAPQADEWEQLNTDHGRLSNAQTLLDAAQGAVDALQADDFNAGSALNSALTQLQQQEHLEPAFGAIAEVLASSLAQVEDAVHSLRAYLRKTDLDPQRLGELDQRMSLWMALARRYQRAPADLAQLLAGWKEQLARLDAAVDLVGLEAAEKSAEATYLHEARAISKARAKAAPQLAKAVTHDMQGLGMEGGLFEVALQKSEQPMQSGLEEVAFLVAGHAGSSPRPVGNGDRVLHRLQQLPPARAGRALWGGGRSAHGHDRWR